MQIQQTKRICWKAHPQTSYTGSCRTATPATSCRQAALPLLPCHNACVSAGHHPAATHPPDA